MDFMTIEAPEALDDRRAKLMEIVAAHVSEWPRVGAALAELRDRQLYRRSHSTWAEFLQASWQMSESYASRLIAASELHHETLPTGKPPKCERLVRPIAALPKEQRADAWHDAIALAGDAEVSPREVAEVVRKRKPGVKKIKVAKPIRIKVPGAIVIVEPGRAYTSAVDALQFALEQAEGAELRRAA